MFDPDSEPCVAPADIPRHFRVSQSTVGQKAKAIRDMFDLYPWHPEFSTEAMHGNDPYAGMVMIDGLVVPIDVLGREWDEELRRLGHK